MCVILVVWRCSLLFVLMCLRGQCFQCVLLMLSGWKRWCLIQLLMFFMCVVRVVMVVQVFVFEYWKICFLDGWCRNLIVRLGQLVMSVFDYGRLMLLDIVSRWCSVILLIFFLYVIVGSEEIIGLLNEIVFLFVVMVVVSMYMFFVIECMFLCVFGVQWCLVLLVLMCMCSLWVLNFEVVMVLMM